MDNDDTGKPRRSLVAPSDPAIGAYAELYPSIGRRLIEAETSVKPEIRRRLQAMHVARQKQVRRRQDLLTETWRLTATEARLALHLADGGSIGGYAELFGVSVGTVRSQLKAIFAKTGVNRQAALVALIPRA
jgi:DNA-binding CsgD family transcriptional regulator